MNEKSLKEMIRFREITADCCANCNYYGTDYEESNGIGHEQEHNCNFNRFFLLPVSPINICDKHERII